MDSNSTVVMITSAEEDRMALTGHSTRESHQIYSHADEKAGQAAIAKLPSLNPKNQ